MKTITIDELIKQLTEIKNSQPEDGGTMLVVTRLHGEETGIVKAEKRFDGSWNYVALRYN